MADGRSRRASPDAGLFRESDATPRTMSESRVVSVLLPVAVDGPYTYRTPDGLDLKPGDIVAVPLGTQLVIGAVWDDPPDETIGHNRLRAVEYRFDVPPLTRHLREFVDWVADYTLATRGMVLRMVLRSPGALEPGKPIPAVRRAGPLPARMTPARQRVLKTMEDGMAWSRMGLAAAAAVSPGVIDGLLEAGTLEIIELPPQPAAPPPDPDFAQPGLTKTQAGAAETLRGTATGGYSVTLLDGVTGSGKTEVYFEAVAATLHAGKQALILLPEIALTSTFIDRFAARFGARPAEWHSEVPPRIREKVWRGVATGELRAVIGARSALFLPFADLGLIVVDEEHDSAFKQEDGVTYHARDMAVVRGHLAGFPVVLSSATPSVESRVNADARRYRRIVIPDRYRSATHPEITAVDLRRYPPERGAWLAPPLAAAIGETVAAKEQALLFLNRRGYAPLTVCRACGHRFQCPNCSAWLVEHRFRGVLACHHCGHTTPKPEACPQCGTSDSFVACGPGVERVAEEVARRFPDARTVILSSDLIGGPQRLRRELTAIAKGEWDIVIGTQLVAKGHNFPLLTLVGVIDADLGLAHGDLRASERTFQILSQVTGRAGRSGGTSRAFIQTYTPEHPVMQAIVFGDRGAFYAREINERRTARLPPFSRLVALIVTGVDRAETLAFASALRRAAPDDSAVSIFGPAEAPLAVIRGRYRFRLLAEAPRATNLQAYVRSWLATGPKLRGSLRVQIDVDPQSFL